MNTKYQALLIFLMFGCQDESGPAPVHIPVPVTSVVEIAPPTFVKSVATPDPFKYELGSYTTRYSFSEKNASRAENVELAAEKLNGKVIDPDTEFSFNDVVGVRSTKAGFKKAPAIFMGMLIPDVGGGVCQVSSTLHAAALSSGIKVVKRLSHSRPSSYILIGLDATVAYPPECGNDHRKKSSTCYSSDLVLKNTSPWSVRITTNSENDVTEPGKRNLTISFWGRESTNSKVEFKSMFSWTKNFVRKTRRHPWNKSKEYGRKVQNGTRGQHAILTVITKFSDGKTEEMKSFSIYPPVDEVWEVNAEWTSGDPVPWVD